MSPCSSDTALRVLLFGSRDGWGQKGDRPSPLGDARQCPLEAQSTQGGRPVRGGSQQWALVQGRLVRPGDPGHGLALPVPVLGKRVTPGIEPCISLGSSRHSRPQQSGEDRLQAGDLRLRVEVAGKGQVTGHLASIRAVVPSTRVFLSPPAGSHSLPGATNPLDMQATSWEVWESWPQARGQKEVHDGSPDRLANQRLAAVLLLPGTRGRPHLWTCCVQTCIQVCSEHQAQPGPASPRLWKQKYSDPIDLALLDQIDPNPINIRQRPLPWVPMSCCGRNMNCRAGSERGPVGCGLAEEGPGSW